MAWHVWNAQTHSCWIQRLVLDTGTLVHCCVGLILTLAVHIESASLACAWRKCPAEAQALAPWPVCRASQQHADVGHRIPLAAALAYAASVTRHAYNTHTAVSYVTRGRALQKRQRSMMRDRLDHTARTCVSRSFAALRSCRSIGAALPLPMPLAQ